ncbi:MAG: restriction endonuclease subunit S [Arenibacter algicola]
MELVETKFNRTEFGEIPVDWVELNLGASSVLKARIGWQGLTTKEYLLSGEYYLITGTDFKDGYIDWDNCVYVEKLRYDQDKNIQIKVGDVLVTKDGTIGKIAFIDKVLKPTTLNSGVFVVRPIQNAYFSRYFYYVLMSDHFKEFLRKLTAGSTISHLYQKDFIHYNLPLPPTLHEQKAIANALSDVDTLIAELDALIEKKIAIKKGAMQQLLTPPHKGGKRLPGFDGEWEEKTLGDIGECIIGLTYKPSDVSDSGTLVLRSSNIQNNQLSFLDNVYVTAFIPPKLRTQIGDILVCVRNGSRNLIGKSAKIDMRCVNESFGAFMSMYRSPFNDYISHAFNSFPIQKQIEENLGATINQITNRTLNSFKVWIPEDGDERIAISKLLDDMDSEITSLQLKKEKYQDIKQGIMQELLTGKTRLV